MRFTSGPITVEIREGMVPIARHVYEDTRCALTDDWPKWVEETLERVDRRTAPKEDTPLDESKELVKCAERAEAEVERLRRRERLIRSVLSMSQNEAINAALANDESGEQRIGSKVVPSNPTLDQYETARAWIDGRHASWGWTSDDAWHQAVIDRYEALLNNKSKWRVVDAPDGQPVITSANDESEKE